MENHDLPASYSRVQAPHEPFGSAGHQLRESSLNESMVHVAVSVLGPARPADNKYPLDHRTIYVEKDYQDRLHLKEEP